MKIENSVALVTGANRGLGLMFVNELLARGARKVYAAARDIHSIKIPGVVAVQLDVTNDADITAAAAQCKDVTLLINNAGIAQFAGFLTPDSVQLARAALETNYFGPLRLSQAFAPILATNGGGAILNVLSVASWINGAVLGVYAASKSAAWSLTNGLRNELRAQGTQVMALHVGFMDTDMTKGMDVPKVDPKEVVRKALDGLQADAAEVLADAITQRVKQGLSAEPGIYLGAVSR